VSVTVKRAFPVLVLVPFTVVMLLAVPEEAVRLTFLPGTTSPSPL
jgi:hypothetical protein